MTRQFLRQLVAVSAERIADAMTARQHLRPRRKVVDVVVEVGGENGVGVESARGVLERLGVCDQVPIGRLRRTELIQLARALHRAARTHPQPALVNS